MELQERKEAVMRLGSLHAPRLPRPSALETLPFSGPQSFVEGHRVTPFVTRCVSPLVTLVKWSDEKSSFRSFLGTPHFCLICPLPLKISVRGVERVARKEWNA